MIPAPGDQGVRVKIGRSGVRFALRGIFFFFFFFFESSHTSDLKIGIPVASPPGVWHPRVSAGTGWPGVSIL